MRRPASTPYAQQRLMTNAIENDTRRSARPARPTTDEQRARAHKYIPGGAHTYSKGDDQFPANAPALIQRGAGCWVWDTDGREWLDYGMGLRSVILGHAHGPVID